MKYSSFIQATNYIPTIGICLFLLLFVYSSTLYPGGSQADVHSVGYDWVNNYWCNLINTHAMNEEVNPAHPIAIAAMIVLCSSLMVFFIQFSKKVSTTRFWRNTIKWGGVFSMLFATCMFTAYHDLMTTLSSSFGVLVVIGMIWEVYKSRLLLFQITGILCILLLAINNYIYYSTVYLEYLPLIQKLTFVIVLGWVVGLNIKIHATNFIK